MTWLITGRNPIEDMVAWRQKKPGFLVTDSLLSPCIGRNVKVLLSPVVFEIKLNFNTVLATMFYPSLKDHIWNNYRVSQIWES
jgi:hypothetical protein